MFVQTLDDIESLERVPLSERGLACSTYDALRQAAERTGDAVGDGAVMPRLRK